MFGFLKKKNKEKESQGEALAENEAVAKGTPSKEAASSKGLFAKLKDGLSRTRENLTHGIANLFLGKKEIDDDLLDDLETQLLVADVGIEATEAILSNIVDKVSRKELKDIEALSKILYENMNEVLRPVNQPLKIDSSKKPFVILMVGINGVGKTTTIGKLAKKFQLEGKSVMLAAGDTFRAAAVEQLQAWGDRNEVPVIAQHSGADSASVIFDALASAKAKSIDVLIADTAGRLHTQSNLMEELKKIKRVMSKIDSEAPHEVMLVVDAGTGQNGLMQVQEFHQAVGLTGLSISKLDGTAKGGIIFAIAKKFGIPIRYIGVGEGINDLRPFHAEDFVDALLHMPHDQPPHNKES